MGIILIKKEMCEELKNKYKMMTHVVNLPCDIGDKIYVLTGTDKSEMVEDFVNVWEIRMDGITGYGYETGPFAMSDIGETVFVKEDDAKYVKNFVERYKKAGGETNES